MTEPITRWVEPCAGMLAVGLWLRGKCDPPIAYMGGKRWARSTILDGLGVAAGSGCRDLWIADAGPAGAFWRAMVEDGDAVCARLDAWADETKEPGTERALYDRLLPFVGTDPAAWVVVAGWSYRGGDATSGWMQRTEAGMPRMELARLARLARLAAVASGGARVYPDAASIPVEVAGRTIVLLDPPYVDTTGYAAGLSRADVVALALAWSEAGAEVLITEREPVVPGWRTVRLYGSGTGSAGSKWEVLTMSPSVRWRAGEQGDLFGLPARAPGGSAMTGGAGRGVRA